MREVPLVVAASTHTWFFCPTIYQALNRTLKTALNLRMLIAVHWTPVAKLWMGLLLSPACREPFIISPQCGTLKIGHLQLGRTSFT